VGSAEVVDDDDRTRSVQRARYFSANALRGTSDECDFAFQLDGDHASFS
jgi:hypothetical protein